MMSDNHLADGERAKVEHAEFVDIEEDTPSWVFLVCA